MTNPYARSSAVWQPAQELALRKAFDDFLKPMKDNETGLTPDAGGTFTALTKAQLEALYTGGNPSVKSVTTPYYQAKVTTWLVSGNRDEEVFENPDTFDVGREPNKHMAFGPGGIHHCMGAHLAKMEVRIAFEELLSRTVDIELAGPPERLRSNFFNGIKRLPVRVSQ